MIEADRLLIREDGTFILENSTPIIADENGISLIDNGSLIMRESTLLGGFDSNSRGILEVKKTWIEVGEDGTFIFSQIIIEQSTIIARVFLKLTLTTQFPVETIQIIKYNIYELLLQTTSSM